MTAQPQGQKMSQLVDCRRRKERKQDRRLPVKQQAEPQDRGRMDCQFQGVRFAHTVWIRASACSAAASSRCSVAPKSRSPRSGMLTAAARRNSIRAAKKNQLCIRFPKEITSLHCMCGEVFLCHAGSGRGPLIGIGYSLPQAAWFARWRSGRKTESSTGAAVSRGELPR